MNPKKKVALLTHGPLATIGGVERYHGYLIPYLEECGFEVDVFEPGFARLPKWIPGFAFPFVQFFFTGLPSHELQKKYSLILTSGYTGGILKGPKILNLCFGSVKSYNRARRTMMIRPGLRFANACAEFFDGRSKKNQPSTVISSQVERELKQDYGVSSEVAVCGIDTDVLKPRGDISELRAKWKIPKDALVGLFVGRWDWYQKGLDRLVPIMQQRPDVHWVVVSDVKAPLEGIASLTAIEKANYSQLEEIYSLADFSIQLSRYESYGYSFVECLACGTPGITTSVGVSPEAYENTELLPLLLEASEITPRDLADQVNQRIDSLKNPEYRKHLRTAARQCAVEKYSLQSWRKQIRPILEKILGERLCK